jgi:hypothetical protein
VICGEKAPWIKQGQRVCFNHRYFIYVNNWKRCPVCCYKADFEIRGVFKNYLKCKHCWAEFEVGKPKGEGEKIRLHKPGRLEEGSELVEGRGKGYYPSEWWVEKGKDLEELKRREEERREEEEDEKELREIVRECLRSSPLLRDARIIAAYEGDITGEDLKREMTIPPEKSRGVGAFFGGTHFGGMGGLYVPPEPPKQPLTIDLPISGCLVVASKGVVLAERGDVREPRKRYHLREFLPYEGIEIVELESISKSLSIKARERKYTFTPRFSLFTTAKDVREKILGELEKFRVAEKEKGLTGEVPEEGAPGGEDPLKVLKLRLARGEITEAEYEKIRKMLEK